MRDVIREKDADEHQHDAVGQGVLARRVVANRRKPGLNVSPVCRPFRSNSIAISAQH